MFLFFVYSTLHPKLNTFEMISCYTIQVPSPKFKISSICFLATVQPRAYVRISNVTDTCSIFTGQHV